MTSKLDSDARLLDDSTVSAPAPPEVTPFDAVAPVADAVLDATTNGAATVKLAEVDADDEADEADEDDEEDELDEEELGATYCEVEEVLGSGVQVELGGV